MYKRGDVVLLLSNVDEERNKVGWSQPIIEMLPSYYLDIPFKVIEIASGNVRLETNHPTFNEELTAHPNWRFKNGISAFLIPYNAIRLCESKPKALFKLQSSY